MQSRCHHRPSEMDNVTASGHGSLLLPNVRPHVQCISVHQLSTHASLCISNSSHVHQLPFLHSSSPAGPDCKTCTCNPISAGSQALQQERDARRQLEAEISLERAESGSLSNAPSAAPTDTESDADADSPKGPKQSRLRRSSRSQRPTGPPSGSPLADYVLQGLPQACPPPNAAF